MNGSSADEPSGSDGPGGERSILERWRETLMRIVLERGRLLLFQLWYGLIVVAVLATAVGWLLEKLIARAGTDAVANYDLIPFLLSVPGICFLSIAIGTLAASYFMERCGVIVLLSTPGEETTALNALRHSLRNAWPLMQLGWLYALIVGGLALPFALTALVVAKALIGAHDINYYLYHQPREWWQAIACGIVLGLGFAFVALTVLVRLAFAMQVVVFERKTPRTALARSWSMTQGKTLRMIWVVGGWWVGTTMVASVLSAAILWVVGLCLDVAGGNTVLAVAILTGFSILLVLINGMGHVLSLSGEAILSNCLYQDGGGMLVPAGGRLTTAAAPLLNAYRVTALAAIVCLGGMSLAFWRVTAADLEDRFTITAHRAGAARAPENTLAALRLAIEDGADLAEIDVQTTRDGQLVVLHDADLARMAADPRRVEDLTFDKLRQIDIGRLKDNAFAGERVATLEEMLRSAKGRIRLNIELKYYRDDPALVGLVIEMLRREGVIEDCVITSFNYAAVQEAKRLAPEAAVGLIVTKAIGDPTKMEADLLSLNQQTVSARLIHRAHARGMQVHAWTVNDRVSMERMVQLGVDSLITDYPAVANELRRDRASLSSAEIFVLRLRTVLLGH